ncbi:flagellin [Pseudoxanthomonas mexicana]|uniref:flagellin n=1 Tax=Pseudoxanthomonas mexicana TaxID=128785 RepID=UPI00398B6303
MSIINTNTIALNAQRNLNTNSASLSTTIQRLSSGLRINSAKDDAAGLAISERFTTQIRGMNQAARNANDGISLAQTAEGALGEIGNNLQRIRELAVQSRNATNSGTDRAALQAEVAQLKSEIDRVADQTSFNGTKLLNGSFTNQAFQVGADQGQLINVDGIVNAKMSALGSWTSVATPANVAGAAPAGVTSGGTTTPGTLSVDLSSADPEAAFSFSLDGGTTTLTVAAASGRSSADFYTAVAAEVTGVTGLSAAASANGVDFTNTSGTAVTISGGMTGTVAAQTTSGGTTTFAALSGDAFTINGTNIEVAASANAAERSNALATAINASSAGVTASVVGGALQLTSDANIVIGGTSSDLTALTGLTAGTTNVVAGTAQTGFAGLDISTVAGADNAILAMDAALSAVNSARADLGAIQNRFTSVVANLQTTSENLSASRSRIRDADFAKETAELSRTQILQQAGTAMLAQANQIPQNVLSLLR